MMFRRYSTKLPHFSLIWEKTCPIKAFCVWLANIQKQSPPLKQLCQLEPNFTWMMYGRSSIGILSSLSQNLAIYPWLLDLMGEDSLDSYYNITGEAPLPWKLISGHKLVSVVVAIGLSSEVCDLITWPLSCPITMKNIMYKWIHALEISKLTNIIASILKLMFTLNIFINTMSMGTVKYRIKHIFSGVYLCITWTKLLTNLHKSPSDFYLFVSELVQVIHQ
jgi:hypothetical protein